jgi:hypothetical protein
MKSMMNLVRVGLVVAISMTLALAMGCGGSDGDGDTAGDTTEGDTTEGDSTDGGDTTEGDTTEGDSTDGGDTADGATTADGADDGTTDDGTDGGSVDGSDGSDGEAIEIMGSWDDNFGGHAEITESMWGDYAIAMYDNADNWAVTQNPEDSEWDPSKYSKIVWTEIADDFSWYSCIVDYGKDTAEEARDSEQTADDSDPANEGCGEFAWTKMMPAAVDGE